MRPHHVMQPFLYVTYLVYLKFVNYLTWAHASAGSAPDGRTRDGRQEIDRGEEGGGGDMNENGGLANPRCDLV